MEHWHPVQLQKLHCWVSMSRLGQLIGHVKSWYVCGILVKYKSLLSTPIDLLVQLLSTTELVPWVPSTPTFDHLLCFCWWGMFPFIGANLWCQRRSHMVRMCLLPTYSQARRIEQVKLSQSLYNSTPYFCCQRNFNGLECYLPLICNPTLDFGSWTWLQ